MDGRLQAANPRPGASEHGGRTVDPDEGCADARDGDGDGAGAASELEGAAAARGGEPLPERHIAAPQRTRVLPVVERCVLLPAFGTVGNSRVLHGASGCCRVRQGAGCYTVRRVDLRHPAAPSTRSTLTHLDAPGSTLVTLRRAGRWLRTAWCSGSRRRPAPPAARRPRSGRSASDNPAPGGGSTRPAPSRSHRGPPAGGPPILPAVACRAARATPETDGRRAARSRFART